jgi:aldose 1-epimerase
MVANTSDVDLPFGVGFHPYFRVPGPFDQWLLQCDAGESWPLTSMVPSGSPVPVGPDLDFRTPRRLGNQHLDDALTGLPPTPGMTKRAALMSMAATVSVSSDEAFGEYVLFTPGSRDAVAIEPYTCATDAVNLAARGISAGWRALPPGETATFHWRVDVE